MNWLIQHSKKITGHTYLNEILKPIINNYNWIVADVEFNSTLLGTIPINIYEEYFILNATQFNQLLNPDFQICWGIVLAIPQHIDIVVNKNSFPFAEGNTKLFEDGYIQHPDAELEIICFDSSYTIVKFKNEVLSNQFHHYFDDAIPLEQFRTSSKM
jgi:hypothetical protein